ncbi:hypothetical protein ACOMHN_061937 [Nucella lapillus]
MKDFEFGPAISHVLLLASLTSRRCFLPPSDLDDVTSASDDVSRAPRHSIRHSTERTLTEFPFSTVGATSAPQH